MVRSLTTGSELFSAIGSNQENQLVWTRPLVSIRLMEGILNWETSKWALSQKWPPRFYLRTIEGDQPVLKFQTKTSLAIERDPRSTTLMSKLHKRKSWGTKTYQWKLSKWRWQLDGNYIWIIINLLYKNPKVEYDYKNQVPSKSQETHPIMDSKKPP